jgi:hypothetical protein
VLLFSKYFSIYFNLIRALMQVTDATNIRKTARQNFPAKKADKKNFSPVFSLSNPHLTLGAGLAAAGLVVGKNPNLYSKELLEAFPPEYGVRYYTPTEPSARVFKLDSHLRPDNAELNLRVLDRYAKLATIDYSEMKNALALYEHQAVVLKQGLLRTIFEHVSTKFDYFNAPLMMKKTGVDRQALNQTLKIGLEPFVPPTKQPTGTLNLGAGWLLEVSTITTRGSPPPPNWPHVNLSFQETCFSFPVENYSQLKSPAGRLQFILNMPEDGFHPEVGFHFAVKLDHPAANKTFMSSARFSNTAKQHPLFWKFDQSMAALLGKQGQHSVLIFPDILDEETRFDPNLNPTVKEINGVTIYKFKGLPPPEKEFAERMKKALINLRQLDPVTDNFSAEAADRWLAKPSKKGVTPIALPGPLSFADDTLSRTAMIGEEAVKMPKLRALSRLGKFAHAARFIVPIAATTIAAGAVYNAYQSWSRGGRGYGWDMLGAGGKGGIDLVALGLSATQLGWLDPTGRFAEKYTGIAKSYLRKEIDHMKQAGNFA